MHLLYFDEIQAFLRHTHVWRHHDYYNEEMQWLPSTSMYRMHEGVGGAKDQGSSRLQTSQKFINAVLDMILSSFLYRISAAEILISVLGWLIYISYVQPKWLTEPKLCHQLNQGRTLNGLLWS